MINEPFLVQDRFRENLQGIFLSQNNQTPLASFRRQAWDQFNAIGLPTRKNEEFQYLSLRKLYEKSFTLPSTAHVPWDKIAPFVFPEARQSVAVFINGHLDLALSNFTSLPSQAMVLPFREAIRSFGPLLALQLQGEKDPFALLNAALNEEGLFVYIPPKIALATPLQVLQIVTEDHQWISPRAFLFFGAFAEAKVLGQVVYLGAEEVCLNHSVSFNLEEGSHVSYTRTHFNVPATAWQFEATRVIQKKTSSFNSVLVSQGAEMFRDDYKAGLVGPGAELNLSGAWLLREKRESHTHVLVNHQAPECRSMQLFKGVVDGSSRSSFEGKIFVERAAQKTEAFQLNHNLLLSDEARAYSKPNLEIFADDVKASHGATVGQIDQEQLFYMLARGINKESAKALLVQGFCSEVIERIPLKGVVAELLAQNTAVCHE